MTEYYVKTDGDDGLDGLSEATAWATISHAQANAVSGAGSTASPQDIIDAKDFAINTLGSLKWFYLDDNSEGDGAWHGLFNVIHIAAGTYDETYEFIFNPPAWVRWEGAGSENTNLFHDSYYNYFQITNDYVTLTNITIGIFYCPEFKVSSSNLAIINSGVNGRWVDTPSNLYWDDCVLSSIVDEGITGVEFRYITDSIFRNISSGSGPVGWIDIYGDRNRFENFVFTGSSFGITLSGDDNLLTECSVVGISLLGNSGITVQNTAVSSLTIKKYDDTIIGLGATTDMPLHMAFDGEFMWLTERRSEPGKCCRGNQNTGEILKSWNVPGHEPRGIAWDGSNLWIVCTHGDNVCYETDTDGNVLSQFNICGSALTWVDGYLYTYCSNSFYKYDTSGNIIDIYPTTVPATALAYDGTYIWGIQSGVESIINKFSVTGELLESIDTHIYRHITAWFSGIAADTDKHIWIMQDGQGHSSLTFLIGDGNQVCTDCDIAGDITTEDGTTLSAVRNDKKFYDTSAGNAWTTVTTTQTILGIPKSTTTTLIERPLLITTDADIAAIIDTWETTDDQNKTWTVEAEGARTITFQLGDMLPDTWYALMADGVKASRATSNASGEITFPAYTGSFSEKEFSTEKTEKPLLTHDEIRTALITTLQADATLDAAIETWLKYLIDTGQLSYPAVYVGTIVQPFDGVCGTDKQYTTIADPMRITVGILSNTHAAATSELGTLYEAVYTAIMATPTLSLSDFKVHSIASITTKPIPKCGRSIIRAEMTLNATCQE